MDEQTVVALEQFAEMLRSMLEAQPSWSSQSSIGDKVSGIQVVGPAGEIKKEWHDE